VAAGGEAARHGLGGESQRQPRAGEREDGKLPRSHHPERLTLPIVPMPVTNETLVTLGGGAEVTAA
jgi:hypothetical protein